jgi:hypothetical protein
MQSERRCRSLCMTRPCSHAPCHTCVIACEPRRQSWPAAALPSPSASCLTFRQLRITVFLPLHVRLLYVFPLLGFGGFVDLFVGQAAGTSMIRMRNAQRLRLVCASGSQAAITVRNTPRSKLAPGPDNPQITTVGNVTWNVGTLVACRWHLYSDGRVGSVLCVHCHAALTLCQH